MKPHPTLQSEIDGWWKEYAQSVMFAPEAKSALQKLFVDWANELIGEDEPGQSLGLDTTENIVKLETRIARNTLRQKIRERLKEVK